MIIYSKKTAPAAVVLQMMGAMYFAFAMINWDGESQSDWRNLPKAYCHWKLHLLDD
jgi:hypothetical protein